MGQMLSVVFLAVAVVLCMGIVFGFCNLLFARRINIKATRAGLEIVDSKVNKIIKKTK